MGQLGEMFPGAKLRKDTPEDAGNGQRFDPGPLDLDGGVIRIRPRSPQPQPSQPEEPAD
jgi:hypothetical protein